MCSEQLCSILLIILIFIIIDKLLRVKGNGNWGSHVPILATILNHTTGNILELGSGYYSTPIIHQYASKDRKILTIDSDCNWINKFKTLFNSSYHEFYCNNTFKHNLTINELLYHTSPHLIDSAYEDKYYSNSNFDVVFVDHSPGYRRHKDIIQMRKNSKIIIVHDTDDTIINRLVFGHEMQDLFKTFKYVFRSKNLKPQTTVLSDTFDVKKLLESYNF